MQRFLWLIGLLIAVVAALGLLAFPIETSIRPDLIGLLSGLGLFVIGFFIPRRVFAQELAAAMRRFAASRGWEFQDRVSTDMLPATIALLNRGTTRRCENVIRVGVLGHQGYLFRYLFYVRGSEGGWNERLVLLLRDVGHDWPDMTLFPETLLGKIAEFAGGQDIDFTGSAPDETFSRSYRLRGDNEGKVRAWFAPRLRAHFAEHPGLALEIKDGDVAIWIPHTLSSGPDRCGWDRSFRTVDGWCRDDLTLMLEAAETLSADPNELNETR